MTSVTDEICEEMAAHDELTLRLVLAQVGDMIAWIGHGDNNLLPDSLVAFAEAIQPTPQADLNDDEIVEAELVQEAT
ncbi:MAG TPA: hypothetical protein VNB49_10560 [Candidatus Dormibacteraeota bacterium]|nr:hypothetical protein [Candidatus Dormibacteraeota bacterium]